jgi:putative monooxygenase ydhR
MHILVVNFALNGIDERQYRLECDECAHEFAAIPGLISKVWLANASTNTYGGIYTWRDRQAMQEFLDGDLFRAVRDDPHITDLSFRDFAVLVAPTEVTRGLAVAHA